MILSRAFLYVLFVLVFRSTPPTEASPFFFNDPDVCNTLSCQEAAQALRDSMDTSAEPCQDFYRYACGGWIDKHPIPEDKISFSATDLMTQQVSARVAELLRTAANEDHVEPVLQAATIFEGCMDEEARETQGLDPLKNLLNSFGGWPMIDADWTDTGYQWHEHAANSIRQLGSAVIIGLIVDADPMESSRHIIKLNQASFGLARDVLLNLNASERNVQVIDAYKNYIVQTAKLLNPDADEDQLESDAEEVIRFESALAKFSKPPEEKKDPEFWYNKMSVARADSVTENTYFKWKDYLNVLFQDFSELTDETEIIVADIDFLKNAIKLAHDTNIRTVANYIGWMLTKAVADETTQEMRQVKFNYDALLTGVVKPPELLGHCSETVIQLLGFAVGRLYVDKYFTEEEKNDVEAILEDIRSTYEITLNHNTWMDPDTRDRALEKLRSMTSMIAYPDWIKNDEELIDFYKSVPDLNEEEYFTSVLKALQALIGKTLKKWNEPTHKTTEWVTPPSVVNAYYNPSANTITFPAGILNLPTYKYGRSAALNYGAIGSIIGHEISHGFDDQGSRYDKDGNLVDWWSSETKNHFHSKSTCFRNQYSSYVEPISNTNLNGNLTIGDDIADNGGVRNAFLAYQVRVMESNDVQEQQQQTTTTNKKLPGIDATPDQLFFLGYASTYCWHMRKEVLEYVIRYSDHTIQKYRVIIPLANSKDFAEAFNCPSGSPMNPASRCVLW